MRITNLKRAISLSIGLHLLLALGLAVEALRQQKPAPRETVSFELTETSPEQAKKQALNLPKAKQIVEQEKTINDEKPNRDAYLSKHDQTVKKQTVARERGEFRNAQAQRTQTPSPSTAAVKAEKKTQASKPTLNDLMGTSPMAIGRRQTERENAGQQGVQGAAGTEASRTNDYLKDVNVSNETMLNTREFKYYTYYNRIRRQLTQYWEPQVKVRLTKMFQQGRSIASEKDHVTKLLIVLNDQGNLVKVQVLNASGVVDLDEAATDAFRSAAPFPNPPKGIVEEDGTVKIRWDFVLES